MKACGELQLHLNLRQELDAKMNNGRVVSKTDSEELFDWTIQRFKDKEMEEHKRGN